MKTPVLFLLIFLVVAISSKASSQGFAAQNIESSKNHFATKKLRESLNILSKNYSENQIYFDFLNLNKRQIKMLSQKFIALKVEEGDFGGYFITILISTKTKKSYIWQVWLYDISGDGEEFEIRGIEEVLARKSDLIDL